MTIFAPVFINKRHKAAWAAHDLCVQALNKFAGQLDLANGSKLPREDAETLCKLSAEVERWQARIAIHRAKARPAKASPGKPAGKPKRPAVEPLSSTAPATPGPPDPADESPLTEYPG